MTAPELYEFKGRRVRIIIKDGAPWFVAKDVCNILDLSDVSMSVAKLDDDEKGTSKVCTLGGNQNMSIISESGLYALVLRSNKKEARTFSKWVRAEVLPSIRKIKEPSKQIAIRGDKRMTVREVANALKCSPEAIKSHIREFWPDLMKNGVTTLLTEAQVTVILERMKQPVSSGTVVNLQSQIVGIETSHSRILKLQILQKQMQDIYEAEITDLKAKIKDDKYKVEFAERALLSEDVLSLNTAAKTIKFPYGVIKFAEKLRELGFLMEHPRNIPYQQYIKLGYFVVDEVVKEIGGEDRAFPTTRITQKGLLKISRVLNRREA